MAREHSKFDEIDLIHDLGQEPLLALACSCAFSKTSCASLTSHDLVLRTIVASRYVKASFIRCSFPQTRRGDAAPTLSWSEPRLRSFPSLRPRRRFRNDHVDSATMTRTVALRLLHCHPDPFALSSCDQSRISRLCDQSGQHGCTASECIKSHEQTRLDTPCRPVLPTSSWRRATPKLCSNPQHFCPGNMSEHSPTNRCQTTLYERPVHGKETWTLAKADQDCAPTNGSDS